MSGTLSWVVGRGGLLGRHVEDALSARTHEDLWKPERPVRWHRPDAAASDLAGELDRFAARVAKERLRWRILWCAGAGVVATPPEALARETLLIERFLTGLETSALRGAGPAEAGLLFFASSAGGVYAGSPSPPPFDEDSAVRALAPYGLEKLAQEELFTAAAQSAGHALLVGRFSNLYGPGQDLSKPQGLVGHVGRASLRRQPVSIYVPLDTIRDYLFAADAGRMVAEALDRHAAQRLRADGQPRLTKIFASELEGTVASVLSAWRQALRRPPLVAFAASPVAELQPRALTFRSKVWPELRGHPTSLALGVDALRRDQLARLMAAGIA